MRILDVHRAPFLPVWHVLGTLWAQNLGSYYSVLHFELQSGYSSQPIDVQGAAVCPFLTFLAPYGHSARLDSLASSFFLEIINTETLSISM